ncbi:MAG: hemolysin family protein [Polyangiales bacterium]
MLFELLIVFALMALNGVFAGAEIAVLSVRKTRLAELVEEGSARARAVLWLRKRPERFLATVQIGITVVGTTAAAFGGDSLAEHISQGLAARAPWLGASAHRVAFVLVIVLISTLEIVVGELIPKSLALRYAERFSVTLGPMLRGMASVVKPLVWLLTGLSNVVLRFFGDRTSFSESRLSPEEIQELVEEAGRTGAIDAGTSEIASRAIDLRELTAADVMVPRSAIVSVDRDADLPALRAVLQHCRFARLPVYERDPENVVGHVALKDLVLPALDGHPLRGATVHPAQFVPSTTSATALLRRMQRERLSMVMVIDELGELLGLVTVSDLLAELVGDILGEGDPAPPALARDADGTAVVPGETPIRDVNRALGMGLPEPGTVTTVAGLCLEAAGRMPAVGERVALADGHVLEVLAATPRKVNSLRVHPPKDEPAPEGAADEDEDEG